MYPKMHERYFSRPDQYRYMGLWYVLLFWHQYLIKKNKPEESNNSYRYSKTDSVCIYFCTWIIDN